MDIDIECVLTHFMIPIVTCKRAPRKGIQLETRIQSKNFVAYIGTHVDTG